MLQNFRDKLKGVTATILVIIIIIPFAFWGIDSLFLSGSSVDEVARVNGEKVTELELQRGVELYRQRLLNEFDSDPALVDEELLEGPVLEQLIRQQLMASTAKRQGMAVADQTFNELIANSDAFKNEGKFDQKLYRYHLNRLGHTPRSYRQTIDRELLASQLSLGVQSSVLITQWEIEAFSHIALQKRSYDYLTISLETFNEKTTVSDDEIAAYYRDHGEDFNEPEKLIVEYIELTPKTLEKGITIDEPMVRQRFEEEQSAAQNRGASWHLAHILIESDGDDPVQRLSDIQEKILGGEDFATLAQTYSDDLGTAQLGGELGIFTQEELPEGFSQAIAKIEPGQISEPIETKSGVHLIKVLDKTEGPHLVFEEERSRIETDLRAEMAEAKIIDYLDRLKEETYNVDSLGPIAKNLGLELGVSQAFGRQGGEEAIARYPKVIEAAFGEDVLEHGFTSDMLELGDQHYAVIKVKQRIPPHRLSLDMVSAEISKALIHDKTAELARQASLNILQRLTDGEAIGVLADEAGRQWEAVTEVTRFAQSGEPALTAAIFKHSSLLDLPITGVVEANDRLFVYSLKDIVEGRFDQLSVEEQRGLKGSLAELVARRELASYFHTLEAGADIRRAN